jgi:hypothetical protein
MKGGRHVSDKGPLKDGMPTSAADLAARFREHQQGRDLKRNIAMQAHQQLNPKIQSGIRKLHRASHAVALQDSEGTDHFDHVQRSTQFAKASSKLIRASFGMQLSSAVAKEWLLLKARKQDAVAQIMITIVMGLIVGFLFFQLPSEFDRAFDRTGVILNVTLLSATAVFNVVPVLIGDREVRLMRY